MFHLFAQFHHTQQFFVPVSDHYTLISNEYGCTVIDRLRWCEVTLFGSTVFFPGPQGYEQAAQYIQEYGSILVGN